MLKLGHMVDDKWLLLFLLVHIWPITQQPLEVKPQFGGQRFGDGGLGSRSL